MKWKKQLTFYKSVCIRFSELAVCHYAESQRWKDRNPYLRLIQAHGGSKSLLGTLPLPAFFAEMSIHQRARSC